jgi:RIO kinase 2
MENVKENEPHSSSTEDEEMIEEDRSEGSSDESDEGEVRDDDGPASRIGTAPEEPVVADPGDINIAGSSANLHETPDANSQEDTISPPRSDLSRSPPQSRSVSPATLEKMMDALDLNEIKNKVTSDLSKSMAKQQRKYHSKRAVRKAGRPQGSKAKQDTRVKADHNGVWG